MPKRPTDKDTAKSNQEHTEAPWNKQFEDDRDDDGSFSRVQKRKHTRGNTILTAALGLILVLVFLIPIVWSAVNKRMENASETPTRISVTSKSRSVKDIASSSKKSSSSSKKASSSSSKAVSSSEKASSSSVVSSSSSAVSSAASSSSTSTASSSSSSSSTATSTYTVQSGDNLYRIAANHGMTLSEIQALNGMGSSITVTPGQVLKVK